MSKSKKTKQNILETATWLISKHGIEKSSLSMIANCVGIQKASIYYYYDSKDALIDDVLSFIIDDYTFDHYFNINEYNHSNFVNKMTNDGICLLTDNSLETLEISIKALNEFLIYGSRDSTNKKLYKDKIISIQVDFINGFVKLLTKAAELNLIENHQVSDKAYVLALTLDNLTNYPMIGIDLDAKSIWKQAVTSVLIRGDKNE